MMHHTHRPKTILAILDGARTIDPYSLVDRHVALPQGVHGFVFRGRPVEFHATASSERDAVVVSRGNHESSTDEDDGASARTDRGRRSNKAAVVDLVFPKGTSRRRAAQQFAKATINPDVLCGIVRSCEGGVGDGGGSSSSSSLVGYERTLSEEELEGDGCEDGGYGSDRSQDALGLQRVGGGGEAEDSLKSTEGIQRSSMERCSDITGSNNRGRKGCPSSVWSRTTTTSAPQKTTSIQVQVQASSLQSREYLCAVSTAEEAESWVVALRWAAERRRRKVEYGNKKSVGHGSNLGFGDGVKSRGGVRDGVISNVSYGKKVIRDGHSGIGRLNEPERRSGRMSSNDENSSCKSSARKISSNVSTISSVVRLAVEGSDGGMSAGTSKVGGPGETEECWHDVRSSFNDDCIETNSGVVVAENTLGSARGKEDSKNGHFQSTSAVTPKSIFTHEENGSSGCRLDGSGDDSKGSINSLLVEDGWFKAEKEKKPMDIVDDTWVNAPGTNVCVDNGTKVGQGESSIQLPMSKLTSTQNRIECSDAPTSTKMDSKVLPSSTKSAAFITSNKLPSKEKASMADGSASIAIDTNSSSMAKVKRSTSTSINGAGGATIVITKVSKFRFSRHSFFRMSSWNEKQQDIRRRFDNGQGHSQVNGTILWLPFSIPLPGDSLELDYEIKLLLLRNCRLKSFGKSTTRDVNGILKVEEDLHD